MLSWEAVSAVSSAFSAIIIAATVVVGYRQIRLAGEQLDHLRSATQFDATLKIFAEMDTPEFRAARLFVERELAGRMEDPAFRDALLLPMTALDETEHREILITRTFEKVGTYARHGLLDTVLVADNCGPLIREMYQKLEECGWFETRRRNNPYSMENFEYLYDAAMKWYENDEPPFRTSYAKRATKQ